jgi:hypothetical protein
LAAGFTLAALAALAAGQLRQLGQGGRLQLKIRFVA